MTEEKPAKTAQEGLPVTEEKSAKTPAAKAEKHEEPEPITSPDVALGNVREEDLVEVRTTMRPDQPLLVSPQEANDLEAQGLLTKED